MSVDHYLKELEAYAALRKFVPPEPFTSRLLGDADFMERWEKMSEEERAQIQRPVSRPRRLSMPWRIPERRRPRRKKKE